MLKLLPIVPPSAAPIVTPGTLRIALCNEVAPCESMSALLMTTTDCGTSIRSAAASDPGPGHSGPAAAGPLHQVRRANQPRLFSRERDAPSLLPHNNCGP